ncbi:hypothetical protein DRF60_10850 [Chryseobacterium elymi]|uniref:Resolvase/invertase-type recombinase catalytic domain-containing protein n=1 Tax=Chryseobacterium elymi TaxID=395936 RepID=A0A3D9DHJ9_9FLAO|nr:hypothetical protein DRF60_10850 [Chryseobacterium elymi]
MQAVYLYIRVSTDEQVVKVYSQCSQLDRLVIIVKITISLLAIFEDYSAKTFSRPEWNKLFADVLKRSESCQVRIDSKEL